MPAIPLQIKLLASGSSLVSALHSFSHRDLRGSLIDKMDGGETTMATLTVRETKTKPRHLYVVATDRRDLFESLPRQFAHDPNAEGILHRREGARGAPRPATPAERRRAPRRPIEQTHLLRTPRLGLRSPHAP